MRRDDRAVAGVVAGILMLGAIVAFVAYANAVWVPAYVANKETSASSDTSLAIQAFGDAAEDRVAASALHCHFTGLVGDHPLVVDTFAVALRATLSTLTDHAAA